MERILTLHHKGCSTVGNYQPDSHEQIFQKKPHSCQPSRVETQQIHNGSCASPNNGHNNQDIFPVCIVFGRHPDIVEWETKEN